MRNKVEIRDASPEDFDSVFGLLSQLWPDSGFKKADMKAVYETTLARTNDYAFCAILDGEIIGFCACCILSCLWQCGDSCYVSALVIDEKHRGKRIGSALMRKAEKLARSRGCAAIELDSALHREEAHRFYEALGIKKMGFSFAKELRNEVMQEV